LSHPVPSSHDIADKLLIWRKANFNHSLCGNLEELLMKNGLVASLKIVIDKIRKQNNLSVNVLYTWNMMWTNSDIFHWFIILLHAMLLIKFIKIHMILLFICHQPSFLIENVNFLFFIAVINKHKCQNVMRNFYQDFLSLNGNTIII
jgi:hypothetical protein